MKPNMRGRKQRPLSRKAKFVSVAVGALLVWQIAMISLAAGHSDSNNDLAAADFAGASQAAAIAAADQRLAAGDFAGAKVFATHALSISAISAASLRDLGLAEQGLGNWQISGGMFSQGAALGWRDGPTQLWLAQAFLQQKAYPDAVQRIDALLRVNSKSADVYQITDKFIENPAFSRAMAGRMSLYPGWRLDYLAHVDGTPVASLLARADLIDKLSHSIAPPTRDEILPILFALMNSGGMERARLLWSSTQHLKSGNIYYQNFEHAGTSDVSPFEWSIHPALGSTLSLEANPNNVGNIVHVTTDGTAAGVLMRQWITLLPGQHTLSYDGAMPIAAHKAFGWRIQCARDSKTILNTINTESPIYQFTVPSGCTSQRVELVASANNTSANKSAEFRKISID